MEKSNHVAWVFELHRKVEETHQRFAGDCPECAKYTGRQVKFTRETASCCFWGLCPEHLVVFKTYIEEAEQLHYEMEHTLGIYVEGYFRVLPDGRHCSMRSRAWHEHLLSLCK